MDVQPVHYLPILTTALSAAFLAVLVRRYRQRGGMHHLWWAIGVFFYGVGTALESTITLAGNTVALNKAWYVAGALLGGYPLAQGSVYLHLRRRTAHVLTAITLTVVVLASVAVLLSPVRLEALEPHRPGGALLGWQWVRLVTPFVNLYAAFFLIGTAAWSSVRFFRSGTNGHRAAGNALIAVGALLPGIGGTMAKAGLVEALYVGECIGLMLIWAGYSLCVRRPAVHPAPVLA
jgi:hypothetical protein